MSYLLDALKKAQLERESLQGDALPTALRTVKSQAMPVWLIVLITVFIGISLYKLLINNEPSQLSAADSIAASPEVEIVQYVEDLSANNNLVSNQDGDISPDNKDLARDSRALELTELPAHILKQIPSLSLQSHIFSPEPEYRSVIINDKTFKQNMFIEGQVILNEITSQGVNIKVADYLIFLPKGISWVATNRAE